MRSSVVWGICGGALVLAGQAAGDVLTAGRAMSDGMVFCMAVMCVAVAVVWDGSAQWESSRGNSISDSDVRVCSGEETPKP